VPALIAKLKEPNKGGEMEKEMQGEILRALGKIGDPGGVDAVLAVLKDGRQKSEVRQGACQGALAARDLRALPVLMSLAKDKKTEPGLRGKAAIVLGLLGGKAEAAPFTPISKSPDCDGSPCQEFVNAASQLSLAATCSDEACWSKALDNKD